MFHFVDPQATYVSMGKVYNPHDVIHSIPGHDCGVNSGDYYVLGVSE